MLRNRQKNYQYERDHNNNNNINIDQGLNNVSSKKSSMRSQYFIAISKKNSILFLILFCLVSFIAFIFVSQPDRMDTFCKNRGSIGSLKTSSNNDNIHSWPGQAIEGVGYPLVKKGTNFVDDMKNTLFKPNKNGKTMIDEFVKVYKNRPDKVNMCGIRFNHALALFVAVKTLNPRLVIESGVNAGQSTYFLRQAKKDVEIIAIDPLEEPICGTKKRWIDDSGKTTYYTGDNFKDIADFDWVGMSKDGSINPDRTLVFLDDHQDFMQRLPSLMKAGIRHLIVEDNYKRGEGATQMDRDGSTPKQLFAYRRKKDNGTLKNADWLYANLISYSEFPPLIPPIMAKKYDGKRKEAGGFMFYNDSNIDIVPPLLRSDLDENDLKTYRTIATKLEFDPELKDDESYMQVMNYNQICYLELLPMAWNLVDKW